MAKEKHPLTSFDFFPRTHTCHDSELLLVTERGDVGSTHGQKSVMLACESHSWSAYSILMLYRSWSDSLSSECDKHELPVRMQDLRPAAFDKPSSTVPTILIISCRISFNTFPKKLKCTVSKTKQTEQPGMLPLYSHMIPRIIKASQTDNDNKNFQEWILFFSLIPPCS